MLLSSKSVFAAEENTKNLPFSAQPLFTNENQVKAGYFELNTQPNKVERLELLIKNHSNEDITILVSKGYPVSNNNQDISYIPLAETTPNTSNDNYFIAENTDVIEKIKLTAKEEKKVSFEVKSPNSDTGVYLGALIFSQEQKIEENNEKTDKQPTFSFDNTFQFKLGIKLNMPRVESDQFEFGEKINVKTIGNELELTLPVKNTNRTIYREQLSYKILSKESDKISDGSFLFKMAPKSNADYSLYWNGMVKKGDYKLVVSTEEGKIAKTYDFSIENKELSRLSENDPHVQVQVFPTWIKWLLIGGTAILISLITLVIIVLRKNKKLKTKEVS